MKFLSFLLLFSVASCGVKTLSKPLDVEDGASTNPLMNYPVCPDELRITDIPSGWQEVRARELITGQRVHFEIVKIQSQLITGLDGRPITVNVEASFQDGKVSENKVLCQNLTEGEFLKFNIEAALHISQRNGSLYRADRSKARVARLSYDLKDGAENKSSDKIESIEDPSAKGLTTEFPLTFMSSTEKIVKFFILPNGELEVRKGEVVRMNGLHAEFFTAIRYRKVN